MIKFFQFRSLLTISHSTPQRATCQVYHDQSSTSIMQPHAPFQSHADPFLSFLSTPYPYPHPHPHSYYFFAFPSFLSLSSSGIGTNSTNQRTWKKLSLRFSAAARMAIGETDFNKQKFYSKQRILARYAPYNFSINRIQRTCD